MALINCPECAHQISDKANSCPHCGLLAMSNRNVMPLAQDTTTCPFCKSAQIQTIKMMCLTATTSKISTGFGANSALDVGGGVICTNTQTALAEKFIPSKYYKDAISYGVGALVVGGILKSYFDSIFVTRFGQIIQALGWIAVILGVITFFISKTKKVKSEQDAKVKLYEKGWICHKCGKTWV